MSDLQQLLKVLRYEEKEPELTTTALQSSLEKIKVLSRDNDHAAVLAEEDVTLLSRYAFDESVLKFSSEALKCLANLLLLKPATREVLVQLDCGPKLASLLENADPTTEFLASRILFLLTYQTTLSFEKLVDEYGLDRLIEDRITSHIGQRQDTKTPAQPVPGVVTADMALGETLKLLFNITFHFPDLAPKFSGAAEALTKILTESDGSDTTLRPPTSLLINALLNLDLSFLKKTGCENASDKQKNGISHNVGTLSDYLIQALDRASKTESVADLELNASSLITLLRKLYDLASSEEQTQIAKALLPAAADRDQPLGKGASFSARLLRLSVSPLAPTLRDNISGLLFEVSGQDPARFIRNIGYGYASGFLMNHNIAVPATSMRGGVGENSEEEEINPVTGQRLRNEQASATMDLDNMTEEEREREAERLFVLFERLRATGVVDVQNPVEQFVNDGRFQELPD